MSANSVSVGSMFGWVSGAVGLLRRNFGSLLGASAVTLAGVVALAAPMWLVMFSRMPMLLSGAPPAHEPFAGWTPGIMLGYGLTVLLGVLLMPPLRVGWFRLCRDIDNGRAVRALDILKPFSDRQLWFRSLRFALCAIAAFAVVFAVFVLVFRSAFVDFMGQAAAMNAAKLAGVTPPEMHFPGMLILGYFLLLGTVMVLQLVYMVGFAEVALQPTDALPALHASAGAVLHNMLKLIVFAFCLFIVAGVIFGVIGTVLVLLAVALAMLHPALGVVAALALYVPVFLCMYPLMFAGNYFAWKSMLGRESPPAPVQDDGLLLAI